MVKRSGGRCVVLAGIGTYTFTLEAGLRSVRPGLHWPILKQAGGQAAHATPPLHEEADEETSNLFVTRIFFAENQFGWPTLEIQQVFPPFQPVKPAIRVVL